MTAMPKPMNGFTDASSNLSDVKGQPKEPSGVANPKAIKNARG